MIYLKLYIHNRCRLFVDRGNTIKYEFYLNDPRTSDLRSVATFSNVLLSQLCDQRPGPVIGFAKNGARAGRFFAPDPRTMLHRCNNVACTDDHVFGESRYVSYFRRNRVAKRAGAGKYFFDWQWFLLIALQPRRRCTK